MKHALTSKEDEGKTSFFGEFSELRETGQFIRYITYHVINAFHVVLL